MRPLFVFAHGAGAASSSAWMVAWRERLETLGEVHAFDYPYMARGSKRPDRLPVLVAAHRDAIVRALAGRASSAVLIGKSMGSRVGCHVAAVATGEHLAAISRLVCLGYPLVGQNGVVRDEVLLALRTPVLFVQGTRDKLCPLDRLEKTRARMTAESELLVVDGGDHSLLVTQAALKRDGQTQADVEAAVLEKIASFVAR